MTRKAVFFDRDGTLIVDKGYMRSPEDIEFLDGVIEALAVLQAMGYQFFVISNQSGIGRGILTQEDVADIHKRMNHLLSEHGIGIQHFYCCPHTPWDGCPCRKPNPELILRAIKQYQIDPKGSYMVGDKLSDVSAGISAGVRSVYLGNQFLPVRDSSVIVVPSVFAFAESLVERG